MSTLGSVFVKSAVSGDTLNVLVKKSPNQILERTVSLAYIECPRFKREGDDPFAFEAQDFVRKAIVGKPVQLTISYIVPSTQREYGRISFKGEDLTTALLDAGLAKLRPEARKRDDGPDSYHAILQKAEEVAQHKKLGIWGPANAAVNTSQTDPLKPAAYLQAHKTEKINAIITQVRDGDNFRVRLLMKPKQHQFITLALAGVRCPRSKRYGNNETEAEPFGDAAKSFVESRLLQRNVIVELLGLAPNNITFIGRVLHPAGNIATVLLSAGLARVADYHGSILGADAMGKLRQIERQAKVENKGMWKDASFVNTAMDKSNANDYEAVVTRVISSDSLEIAKADGTEKRIQLSSVRHPRPAVEKESSYQLEAREFLRKKLIGKQVTVSTDFVRPGQNGLPPVDACTVTLPDGTNAAMLVVENGYASVVRHRREDLDRSPLYDHLLETEARAQQAKKGMWSGKKSALKEPVNASESVVRSRQYLPSLQKSKRLSAVIEFVVSGSRFRCYSQKENCNFAIACAGIRTPRYNKTENSERCGEEAYNVSKPLLQKDVELEILSVDNSGCFIGNIYTSRNDSIAEVLLEKGLAWSQGYPNQSNVQRTVYDEAEQRAKAQRIGLWENYVEPTEKQTVKTTDTDTASKGKTYVDVVLSDIGDEGKFSFQIVGDEVKQLEGLMKSLAAYKANAQSLDGQIKVGANIAALSSYDNAMYRARILRCDRDNNIADVVLYDYGSVEQIPFKNLFSLPENYRVLKPQAHTATLTFVQFPSTGSDYADDAKATLHKLTANKQFVACIDGENNNVLSVTLIDPQVGSDFEQSINAQLVEEGVASLLPKKKRSILGDPALLEALTELQENARRSHIGMWTYGDPLDYED
ncbi:RNA-binding protein Snd1 [Schizosaccharomyces japonicus yFS275]|uniref:RNA-binding protein Snd1 n=1 Tax=Schizosaccharomyces japonicus (strain yFS275 / FY16936) TaxID=402676 RepID=B6K4Z1_SCHJY|nr:RNA-binding protein Snd1 [Schizosaccharomyces japonicus yFS275]EEB08548.1 RNA-binding protein Snd1 [Schizosaccharomyces japonicus yFS275]